MYSVWPEIIGNHINARHMTVNTRVDCSMMFNVDEHSKRHKRNMIMKALNATPPDVATLRQLSISRGGLLDDCLRKRAWPCLLDIDTQSIPPKPGKYNILCFLILYFVSDLL